MLRTFLKHQFIAFSRSRNLAGNIVAQAFIGIMTLYFLVLAIGLGFYMENIIPEAYPDRDMIEVFIGFIIYYFLADFLFRIQLQELPTLSIVPYLHLNISRKKIISFLNIRGLFSVFNIAPLLIFIPFISTKIAVGYGIVVMWMMVLILLSLIVLNNYLVLYLKRKLFSNFFFLLTGLCVVAGLAALDYFGIISLSALANSVFGEIVKTPLVGISFTLMAFAIFIINTKYLLENLYIEEISTKAKSKTSTDYLFLNRFGKVGELCALEIKLIFRHKRSKTVFLLGLLSLFYGVIFYQPEQLDKDQFGFMVFAAIFMTGSSIINYGQYMFAWQSAHFDGLLANKINYTNFIKAKFLLFTITSTIVSLIAALYSFISWKILLVTLAAYLYNMGFGIVIVLWFATKNYKRMDISKSGSFNWQGGSALQLIMSIPLLILPVAIYVAFSFMGNPYLGLLALGLFGLITLLSRNFWVNKLTRTFIKKKYKIAEGFRE